MSQTDYEELKREWKEGWQLDLEYILPRVIFKKGGSICYMYDSKDFDGHLRTCGLTTLEYLEGKSFYRDNWIELLNAKLQNHLAMREKVDFAIYNVRDARIHITTVKGDNNA